MISARQSPKNRCLITVAHKFSSNIDAEMDINEAAESSRNPTERDTSRSLTPDPPSQQLHTATIDPAGGDFASENPCISNNHSAANGAFVPLPSLRTSIPAVLLSDSLSVGLLPSTAAGIANIPEASPSEPALPPLQEGNNPDLHSRQASPAKASSSGGDAAVSGMRGGASPPAKGTDAPEQHFPRMKASERCGSCATCLNPLSRKACLTRR